MIDQLVLGTVQLGMPYGIGNHTGKPDFDNACDIIKTAFDSGILRFDTAQAYGDSEEVLGKAFDRLHLKTKIKVYTKLDPKIDLSNTSLVHQSVENSLRKLKVDRLEGILLHDEGGVNSWEKNLGKTLRNLVIEGKVKSIGVSFYTPQKAFDALDIDGIDFIQVPANILDRRFEDAGVFRKAQECNKSIFIRSIFLQGLLLMPLDQVPEKMRFALSYLQQLDCLASDMKLSRQELVLGYAAQRWSDAFILIGVESHVQIMDNVKTFCSKTMFKVDDNIFKNIPDHVLNPVLWSDLRHS